MPKSAENLLRQLAGRLVPALPGARAPCVVPPGTANVPMKSDTEPEETESSAELLRSNLLGEREQESLLGVHGEFVLDLNHPGPGLISKPLPNNFILSREKSYLSSPRKHSPFLEKATRPLLSRLVIISTAF